ncbi:hypothetical protein LTR95_001949 [Oleoguttula sp. CCFEE 5521]
MSSSQNSADILRATAARYKAIRDDCAAIDARTDDRTAAILRARLQQARMQYQDARAQYDTQIAAERAQRERDEQRRQHQQHRQHADSSRAGSARRDPEVKSYSMRGWWVCHIDGQTNNPALAPERCPTCGHTKCVYCHVY